MQRSPSQPSHEHRQPAPFEGLIRQFHRPGFQQLVFFTLLVLISGLFLYSVFAAWPFTTDDTYIPIRYARNLAISGQLNWNLGDTERVEGYSSSLYMFLAFIAFKLSLAPVLLLKGVALVALLASSGLVYHLSARYSNRWGGLLALAFYTGYFGTVWWGVSGLETPLYVALSLTAFLIYLKSGDAPPAKARKDLAILGLLVAVIGMIRPEGPVIGIVLAAHLIIKGVVTRRPPKAIFADAAWLAWPFILLYGAFFLARYSYFHEIWPNTYTFKTAYRGEPHVLIDMFLRVAAFPLIFGLIGLMDRAKRSPVILFLLYATALVFLLHGVDPVIAHNNRHASVGMALTAVVFAMALHQAGRLKPWVMVPVMAYLLIGQLGITGKNIGELREAAAEYHERSGARFRVAEWLNAHDIRNYAVGDAGIIPLMTPMAHVYDYYGLNSRIRALTAAADKDDEYYAWLAAQRPEAIVVTSRFAHTFKPRNGIQIRLAEVFSPDAGYEDPGLSFGGPSDKYFYRLLIRKDRIQER